MKTMRRLGWMAAGLFLLSMMSASAAPLWGTFNGHYVRSTQGRWSFLNGNSVWLGGYSFDVGAGCASLTVETLSDGHGAFGDVDLYLKFGGWPSFTTYSQKSIGNSYTERIQLLNPPAGRYYVKLYAYRNYMACFRISTTQQVPANWRTDMLNRVNNYRVQYGREALTTNAQLQAAAQKYAYDMTSKNYFGGADHHGSNPANNTLASRVGGELYGSNPFQSFRAFENITNAHTTVAAVMNAWWANPEQRSNILKTNVVDAGFGYSTTTASGPRWVQVFADTVWIGQTWKK